MKYIIILLLTIVQCTLSDSQEDPFMRSIMGKTYYTWTFEGDIIQTQEYKVYDDGRIIRYQSTEDSDTYDYVHVQTLSAHQAIYLQESSVRPLYFGLISENEGKDIYQAYNPNSENTNQIDWASTINFIKSIE